MIAMQYSFVLPADYNMAIIDRRIRDKGPLLDGFPLLRFKAYLSARKRDVGFTSAENLYAPFYLWNEPEGLNNFLTSPGFAALTRDFGWPVVRTWMAWHIELGSALGEARYANRKITPIAPYSDLAACREQAVADTKAAFRNGALAALSAFDPTSWTMLQFRLWRAPAMAIDEAAQVYAVGHVSLPAP